MVTPDLYAALGVSRNATPEEIKRAHRHRSKRSHPDVSGGKPSEEFLAVQLAYEVLRDGERRERYDRTGATAAPKFSLENEIANTLSGLIDAGLDPRLDLLDACRMSVKEGLKQLVKQKAAALKKAAGYRAAARRLKFKRNTLIHEGLEGKARALGAQAAEIPDRIKVGEQLLSLLQDAEYQSEKLTKNDFAAELLKSLLVED